MLKKQTILNGYLLHGKRRDCMRSEFLIKYNSRIFISYFSDEYRGKTVRIKIEVVDQ